MKYSMNKVFFKIKKMIYEESEITELLKCEHCLQEGDKLKRNIRDVEDLIKKLQDEMDMGENLIADDCEDLRSQVKSDKEKKLKEISEIYDAYLSKIDSYEDRSKIKYREISLSEQKAKESIKLVNDSFKKQKEHLRQMKIDEEEIMACNQKMNELKKNRKSKKNQFLTIKL